MTERICIHCKKPHTGKWAPANSKGDSVCFECIDAYLDDLPLLKKIAKMMREKLK